MAGPSQHNSPQRTRQSHAQATTAAVQAQTINWAQHDLNRPLATNQQPSSLLRSGSGSMSSTTGQAGVVGITGTPNSGTTLDQPPPLAQTQGLQNSRAGQQVPFSMGFTGLFPALLSSGYCVNRLETFRRAHNNTQELQWVWRACSAPRPDHIVRDLVFLLVCQIISLGHLNPGQLPEETWYKLRSFERTHTYLSNALLPRLVSPALRDDFLMFIAQFPAPFSIIYQWDQHTSLMKETFDFFLNFEANFATFARQIGLRAQPPMPEEIFACFGTASEVLHTFLYGFLLETSMSVSVTTAFGQTQWRKYHGKFLEMKNKIALECSSRNVNAVRPQQLLPIQNISESRPTLASQNSLTIDKDPRRRLTRNTNPENRAPRERQTMEQLQTQPMSGFPTPNSAPSQSPSFRERSALPHMSAQGSFPIPTQASTRLPMPYHQISSPDQAQPGPFVSLQSHQTPQARLSLQPNSFFPHPQFFAPSIVPPDPARFVLHQARLTTPRLLLGNSSKMPAVDSPRSAYRYVSGFALPPQTFSSTSTTHQWHFDVSQDHVALKPEPEQLRVISATTTDEVWRIQQDSILFIIRCVRWDAHAADSTRDWVTSDNYWPPHVYYEFNENRLEERRKLGYGRDLPIDVTAYIRAGRNSVQITCNMDKTVEPETFCLAVEMVTVNMHDKIMQNCKQRIVPKDTTVAAIASQLSSDDDELHITSMTIGLLDPMLTSKIWAIPTRGPKCRHREAFDLETFLQSRPSRPGDDVTTADAWKCPICGSDARPNVLLIDEWLVDVRKDLDVKGRLDARAIKVEASGGWTIVEEREFERTNNGKEKAQPVPANVMELDSD